MEIHLIWAQDKNGGIGKDGKLPWHISEDLKNFKSLTLNSTVIMGRKTWDSLPTKPLPNRKNIILSKTKKNGQITYQSFEECLQEIKKQNLGKIFVIGGRSIYQLFFQYANYLHITNIKLVEKNINEFFPININEIESKFRQKFEKKLSDNATYALWEKL